MKILARGAEAILYLDKNKVIKDRVKKSYRINELDKKLRKFRTKRESKIISKLENVPKLFEVSDYKIVMEFINGKVLRDVFDKKGLNYCKEIGRTIKKIHDKGIIHGDLTTSNMIVNNKIYFIDFGLGFFSDKLEDRAVDLHLLRQALESKHYELAEEAFNVILDGYNPSRELLDRLGKVESRGRYKKKRG